MWTKCKKSEIISMKGNIQPWFVPTDTFTLRMFLFLCHNISFLYRYCCMLFIMGSVLSYILQVRESFSLCIISSNTSGTDRGNNELILTNHNLIL